METAMKNTGLALVALTAVVALSGCAGRYYDRDYRYYGDSRYDSAVPGGGVYYSDRTPGNPYYTDYPNREYRDRDGSRFNRYDD
jgi:hypothetical protein